MGAKPWSKEEEDALRKLAEKGYTLQQICEAKVFNRTFAGLHRKAHVLGISLGGKPGEIDQDAFRRMMGERDGSDRREDH